MRPVDHTVWYPVYHCYILRNHLCSEPNNFNLINLYIAFDETMSSGKACCCDLKTMKRWKTHYLSWKFVSKVAISINLRLENW